MNNIWTNIMKKAMIIPIPIKKDRQTMSLYYYNQSTFFATEKINLPRGKVVNDDSLNSSPSHGFR